MGLSVRFKVRFLKYTIWQQVIEKMTRTENLKAFSIYVDMLHNSLGNKSTSSTDLDAVKKPDIQDACTFTFKCKLVIAIFVTLGILFFSTMILYIFHRMNEIEKKIDSILQKLDGKCTIELIS